MAQTQLPSLPQRPARAANAYATNAATISDAFVSVGCVGVRRYAAQHTVYPMWPQGIEKSRVEIRVVYSADPRQSSAVIDKNGSVFKQQAFRTPVRMCIQTCDGVQPACSIEFTTKGQNVISEFWDRAALIRGSTATVVSGNTADPRLIAGGSGVQQKMHSVTIPAVSVLLTFDVRRDAKMFEEFLFNVFESETGLLGKSLGRLFGKNSTEGAQATAINNNKQSGMHANGKSIVPPRNHRGGGDNSVISNAASKNNSKKSCFDERTDESSSSQYFQFYSYLSQQQNMLQDYLRTATYQRAILSNLLDFLGKTVMDVGAGSGILSYFAVQAGARKVYAVEASSMAVHCRRLIEANGLQDKIVCINKKLEEIDSLGGPGGELVDIIISEPLGYMLVNERMLETYLHAKKFLKPGGNMYPSQADLHCAPFCDESLYMEQLGKANFWHQNNFYGIDLSSLRSAAFEESFRQPIVDTFDMRILMAPSIKYTIDFLKATEDDLHRIHIPVEFVMHHNGTVHGLCFWFDAAFRGSEKTIWLSTAPSQPLTHWYQVRCLLQQPLYCIRGQTLYGSVTLTANARQSYDIEIMLTNSTTGSVATNQLDLKSPCFRMFAAAAVAASSSTATTTATNNNVIMQQSTNNTAVPALLVQQHQPAAAAAASMPSSYSGTPSSNVSSFTGFGGAGAATSSSYNNNALPLNGNVMFVAGNSTNYNMTPTQCDSSPTNTVAAGSSHGSVFTSSVPGGVFSTPFRFTSTSAAATTSSKAGESGGHDLTQHQQAVMSSFNDLILQQQQAMQRQQQQAAALSGVGSNDAVIDAGFRYTNDGVGGNNNTANGVISAMMADVVITSPNSNSVAPSTTTFSSLGAAGAQQRQQPSSGGGRKDNNVFSTKNQVNATKHYSHNSHHQRRGGDRHHHHHRTPPQPPVVVASNNVAGAAAVASSSNGEAASVEH